MTFKNSNSRKRGESVETFESGPRNNRQSREVVITKKGGIPMSRLYRSSENDPEEVSHRVDPHNHLDDWSFSENGPRHGMSADELANALILYNAERPDIEPLVSYITSHSEADVEGAGQVEAKIIQETREDIQIGVGAELNLRFRDRKFHVNVLFRDKSKITYTPPEDVSPRERRINIDQLRELKENNDVVVILNHPFWQAKTKHIDQAYKTVMALLETGLIDGYEILNGAYLQNFTNRKSPEKLLKMEVTNRLLKIIYTIKCYADFISSNPNQTLAAIGASDSHRAQYVGSAYTEVIKNTNDYDIPVIEAFFDSVEDAETVAVVEDIKSSLVVIRCIKTLQRKLQRAIEGTIMTADLDYDAFQRHANIDTRKKKKKSSRRKKRGRYRNGTVGHRKKRNSN